MLRQRLLAAILGLPMLFFLLWLNWYFRSHGINSDDLPLLLVVAIIAGASGWEASGIVRHRYPQTSRWNGMYTALILPFIIHAIRPSIDVTVPQISSLGLLIDSLGATTAVMLLFLGVWGDIEQRGQEGIQENMHVVSAGLYLGVTTVCLLLIGLTPFREIAVVFIFAAVFALDTAAYFGGKLVGGAHLAPSISPKKTWSGAFIGLLGACALCLVFLKIPGAPHEPSMGMLIPWWGLALIGASIGIFGQAGDLLESAFKRWGGVKDSGAVLLGHGGFLDRFDSLFLAAPVCYILFVLFLVHH